MIFKPDRFAVRAFDQILGVTVGMHVDLYAGSAVANWAVHQMFSFFILTVRFLKYIYKRKYF
jgi:hypothetical protein